MFKISYDEFQIFIKEYNDYDSYERLGQAFINKFAPMGYTNAALFYETNIGKAYKNIQENHIDFSTASKKE